MQVDWSAVATGVGLITSGIIGAFARDLLPALNIWRKQSSDEKLAQDKVRKEGYEAVIVHQEVTIGKLEKRCDALETKCDVLEADNTALKIENAIQHDKISVLEDWKRRRMPGQGSDAEATK